MRKLKTVLWCLYACIFAFLAVGAVEDSSELGYSIFFVVSSGLSYIGLTLGILAYGLSLNKTFSIQRAWKLMFPLFVADFAVGIYMDATVPTDYSYYTYGFVWVISALLICVILAPAFYANFKVAYGMSEASLEASSRGIKGQTSI